MTIATISKAIKSKKPVVIKERGMPRYVVLDWKTYKELEMVREDAEDLVRLQEALRDPRNKNRINFSNL